MRDTRKEFDPTYRLYLKESYISQISKVRRVLGRDILQVEDLLFHTLETLERELILLLQEVANPETITYNPPRNSKKRNTVSRNIYRTSSNKFAVSLILNGKRYHHGTFKNWRDAQRKRNEVFKELGLQLHINL